VNAAGKNFDLLPTSPARDAGTTAVYHGITIDGSANFDHDLQQRPRPRGSTVDLGAYEYQDFTGVTDWMLFRN